MYLKKLRNNRIALVESTYIRKGAVGNTHGYTEGVVICRLSASATSLPADIEQRLNEGQRRYLDEKLLLPNRQAEAKARAAAEAREKDPTWRLHEAARLISEARALCLHQAVNVSAISMVRDALNELAPSQPSSKASASQSVDPLTAAISAVRAAASAVAQNEYGQAPDVGVRESSVYRKWQELNTAVTGSDEASLQRSLQRAGWVKTRGAA